MSDAFARIVFVGCFGSGKTTSFLSTLARGGHDIKSPDLLVGEHSFGFQRAGGKTLELALSVSSGRSVLSKYDPNDRDSEPAITAEIDRIAKSDALVFVADSSPSRQQANTDQHWRLRRDLRTRGVDLDEIPLVIQANKRDLPELEDSAAIFGRLRTKISALVESVAIRSEGTLEAVRTALQLSGHL